MRKQILTKAIFIAGLLALLIPATASAQSWPDYRRDRDYERNRDYDRDGRYDHRYLRDSIHRLDRLAKNFEKDLDRELDRSHEDGSRHEDRVNNEARDFRDAVGDLKSRFGNGRDLNRSANEAQQVLRQGNVTERAVRHHFYNGRLASQWSQIRRELNVIANEYGYRSSVYDDDYYRRDRNRRDDDIYRRRNPNDVPWWERIRRFPN